MMTRAPHHHSWYLLDESRGYNRHKRQLRNHPPPRHYYVVGQFAVVIEQWLVFALEGVSYGRGCHFGGMVRRERGQGPQGGQLSLGIRAQNLPRRHVAAHSGQNLCSDRLPEQGSTDDDLPGSA